MFRATAVLGLTFVLSGTSTVQAQGPVREGGLALSDPRTSASGRPELGTFFVEFGPSLGGPSGWIGASLGYLPAQWLALRLGGGLGGDGGQLALLVSAHAPIGDQLAIGLEVGPSAGPYAYSDFELFDDEDDDTFEWDFAIWGNLALSTRIRMGRAWWVRFYAGYGRVLNPGSARCVDADGRACDAEPGYRSGGLLSDLDMRFLGAGFAYTFDP